MVEKEDDYPNEVLEIITARLLTSSRLVYILYLYSRLVKFCLKMCLQLL
jgi:hypothetical protein